MTTAATSTKTFLALLRVIQKIDSEFPLQYAICLGEIALDEGLSLTDLSLRTGMPLSTVSRIVGALSSHRQRGVPYDLVKVSIVPEERRRKELRLTPRGHDIIAVVEDILSQTRPERLRA
ncbi:MAG: helix-turn-helix domain-containing protein [Alphaproteobacteria bacterium]|nr:helix-turn-helix domain-containing protein [Alphaproteobacteria bacterium]